MPFNNPILAGEELIRNSIRSENFVSALESEQGIGVGWSIRRDGAAEFSDVVVRGDVSGGSAAFNTLAANGSLLYKGQELSTLLDVRARGVVAYGSIPAQSRIITSTDTPILEVVFPMKTGRAYRLCVPPIRVAPSANGVNTIWFARWKTEDGTNVTNGTDIFLGENVHPYNNEYSAFSVNRPAFWGGPDRDIRVCLFCVTLEGGSRSTLNFDPVELWVYDDGIVPANTAINRYNGGSQPIFKSFDIQPYASRTYRGDNGNSINGGQYDNLYMHQGDIGIDGNRRSWAWFDVNNTGGGNGLGSIADMNGAASVDYLELFLYFDHWYYSSGGTAFIGYHNSASPSSTQPPGGIPGVIQEPWPGRDIGKWVNLKGTPIETAIRNGTFRGFMLGDTGNATRTHYGYAGGANGVNGFQPGLRAGYYK